MRRSVSSTLLLVLLFAALGCKADKSQPFRIGILAGLGPDNSTFTGFMDGLIEMGYTEGGDISFDLRTPKYDLIEHRRIIEDFINEEVDLIFVYPTYSALLAKELAQDSGIPVVFAVSYTEGYGLIEDVADPGNGITGVRYPGTEIVAIRYEIMKSLIPSLQRLAVIYYANQTFIGNQLTPIRELSKEDGIELVEIKAKTPDDLFSQLEEWVGNDGKGFDAILTIPEALIEQPEVKQYLGEFCGIYDIPIGGSEYTELSKYTLFYVGINFYETGRQAASLADKIISGIPAGNCPVISSPQYMVINYAQAKKKALDVPPSLLIMADEIIQ